jgi:C4-dicarboxylate transporter, DctQ subunit
MTGDETTDPQAERGWRRLMQGFDDLLLQIATGCMALAVVVMFYEAMSRSTLGASHWWAEELVRFLVVWSLLLAFKGANQRGNFIRMDILYLALSERIRRYLDAFNHVLGMTFSAILAYAGWLQVQHLHRIGMMTESNLDLPLWLVRLILPLGAALYFLFFFVALIDVLAGRRGPDGGFST